jgi:GDP-L-fucose synthase
MAKLSKDAKILVAGARGMVGSAIVRKLQGEGFTNVLAPYRQELDYLNQANVEQYFRTHKIDAVYFAAAKVGGILANNTFQADFLYENITMAANTIHAAAEHLLFNFLFLGFSCIYT